MFRNNSDIKKHLSDNSRTFDKLSENFKNKKNSEREFFFSL